MYKKTEHKSILIFGGTGSLGTALTKRFFADCKTNRVAVFARGEERHRVLKQKCNNVFNILGDIRDYQAVHNALLLTKPDIVINAAALKQIPICENYPYEAVLTNVVGTYNLIKAIESFRGNKPPANVLSISTDKAPHSINSYAMTKALQERIHLCGQFAEFKCVRYGNVLESTGSVVPIFKNLLAQNKDLTVFSEDMTRFLLSLDDAVDLIMTTLNAHYNPGKIFIPKIKSARIVDLASIMIEKLNPKRTFSIGNLRPGEKVHEILFSEHEIKHIEDSGDVFVLHDIKKNCAFQDVSKEFSSRDVVMSRNELEGFLIKKGVFQ